MYQSHWGLLESPFQGDSAVQFIHHSPTHEEALARLQFLVDNHRRLGLLMGASGSGKSLVLEVFAQRLRRRGLPVVKIGLLGVEPAEMLLLLATGLKLNPEPSASPAVLWRAITDRLTEFYYQKLETVVLLDDADCADDRVLAQVARLVRHDSSPQARLTSVLACRRENMVRLGDRLLDLAELRIDLEPWDPSDTTNYLNTSLAQSGSKLPIFSQSAIDRLHELTHGIPRRAAQLADLSLLAGAGADLPQIDADVVESAYHELGAGAEE
ncbi:MAG: AAA family ATPase [Thermoguttaceae bacterium]|jgi:type II secretory pathway predicted ATPase ExeA